MSSLTLKDVIEIVGKTIALITLIFTVTAYFSDRSAQVSREAKSQAFSYANEYRKTLQSEQAKMRIWLSHYTRFGDINEPSQVPDEEFRILAEEFLFSSLKNEIDKQTGFVIKFEQLVEFFSNVNACYEAEICDKSVTQELLCDPATTFYGHNIRMINYYEESYGGPDFSESLEKLLSYCKL